ncbi:ABC transporter ATP-binding protein [Variovorax sp. tm]|uniref:ABC transporter ATP-binding protein n=1 Tax=Variovorax atrisoli TaxID=3394203 RepID=UPI003A7F9B2A
MTPLLKVTNLSASYGAVTVLHGIDLEVSRGRVTALLGANGAGKTSALRAICGLLTRKGSIELDGRQVIGLGTEDIARLGIGHVPDGRGTFTQLSVEDNLRLGGIFQKEKKRLASDIERIYAYFPILKTRRLQQAGLLSGGEQQMLAVSRALMSHPRLLLLDEPSFGLAPRIVEEIFSIFRQLNEKEGLSILLVEQNATLALEIAQEAYLIETGRIVFTGSAASVRNNEDIRRAYLGG